MGKTTKKLNGALVALVAAVTVIVLLVTTVALTSDNSKNDGSDYVDPTTGLGIDYSTDLKLEANDPPVGAVLFNLTKSDPRVQVTAWYEEGESVTDNKSMLEYVKQQLDSIYPGAFIKSEELVTVNGYQGAEMIFDYTTSSNLKTTQRMLLLIKDDDTSATIACQAMQDQFESVNQQYFDEIISSATFE